jgi:hypothetical protein
LSLTKNNYAFSIVNCFINKYVAKIQRGISMTCESCNINEVEVEISTDEGNDRYLLCHKCQKRFLLYALRPLEFFNLASIHGHSGYLHDDFYDFETGQATQPKIEVNQIEKFPFPELANIKSDLTKLVNYACVQYPISDDVITFLKSYKKTKLLNLLKKKVEYNRAINYKAYEIAAKTLGLAAKDWIYEEWKNKKENELLIFAQAISKCFDSGEAFEMITNEIESGEDKYLSDNITALLYLQSPKTLDWIEKISGKIINVPANWGVLSAASEFSWTRAKTWLNKGRPLSLIALDALIHCTTVEKQNQPLWLRKHPPTLLDSPTADIIANTITSYLETDRVPRTKSAVDQIIHNLFAT